MDQTQISDGPLRIGEVARGAGVSVDAIRFYERLGLVEPDDRTASGYRLYGPRAAKRIADLKTLQSAGLTLEEIATVFASAGDGDLACSNVSPSFDAVIDRLESKIAELEDLRDSAVAQAKKCGSGGCSGSCP